MSRLLHFPTLPAEGNGASLSRHSRTPPPLPLPPADYPAKPDSSDHQPRHLVSTPASPISAPATPSTFGGEPASLHAAAPAALIFDRASLLDRVLGDEEFAYQLMAIFLLEAPKQIQGIQESCASSQPEAAGQHAHTLRGMAANLGAERLRKVAGDLEQLGKRGDLAGAQALLPELTRQFDLVKECLAQQL